VKYRPLGKTGLSVSVIGLGTHQFSGEWAKEFSAGEVERMLGRARELGINFLDTAECYGDHAVESVVGNSIKSRRADWMVATKFGHAHVGSPQKTEAWSADQVRRQLEDSLRALQTDHIDLYQFHSGGNEAFQNEELWTMLHEQVRAGKIRWLGLSLAASLMLKNDLQQLHAAPRVNVSAVQVVYNRLQTKAGEQVFPFCQKQQLGVLARVPLAKGFLGGNYRPGAAFPENDTRSAYGAEFNNRQLELVEKIRREELPPGQNMAQWALAWCLKNPAVASVIVGCKTIAQLESNAAAGELAA
jgi:aryl-alcohol dehydrogenase-like predicted oxidoreductase